MGLESFDAAAQDTDEDPLALSQPKAHTDLYSAPSDDEEVFTTPLKKNQPVKVPGAFKLLSEKTKKQKNILPSDSEDYDDELAISTPKAMHRARPPIEDSEKEDEETSILTQDREDTSGEGDDDEDKVPVASAARRRSRPTIVVSDDEDDEAPVLSNSQPRSVITGNQNKGKGKTVTEQDSDEDDDVITPSPSKRRRSFAISDDDDDDDDEEPVISPLKRRKPDVESDESDIVSSPPKRSRHVIVEDNEDEDEDEDEDDESDVPKSKNQSSVSPFTPSRYTRQAKPPKRHRTAKQKAAELLRRKRAGEKIDQLTESSSDDEDGGGLYDSDPELQALEVFEDEEPSPETSKQGTGSTSRQNDSNYNANNDDEEEGFIVEDDDDHPLGMFLLLFSYLISGRVMESMLMMY